MAHSPGTGLDPRVIVPEHSAWAGIPIRKQTEFLILEKLKPALEAAGSSLERSLKAQIYLADIAEDRKSTRLNSSRLVISHAVFCLKKKKQHLGQPECQPRGHQRVALVRCEVHPRAGPVPVRRVRALQHL